MSRGKKRMNPRRKAKFGDHPRIEERNKETRRKKEVRKRVKWANCKEYLEKQAKRLERLMAKKGYETNIERGKKEKEENKKIKQRRKNGKKEIINTR